MVQSLLGIITKSVYLQVPCKLHNLIHIVHKNQVIDGQNILFISLGALLSLHIHNVHDIQENKKKHKKVTKSKKYLMKNIYF